MYSVLDILIQPAYLLLFLISIIIAYTSRKCFFSKKHLKPLIPKMQKRDFTLEELEKYDGKKDDKRILIAVNGKVFDVTNNGQEFYGEGGPYEQFAGKDASRGLACFSLDRSSLKDGYDDLSDLSPDQMKALLEWELQFSERYDYIGRLLKHGEPHRVYEPEDSDLSSTSDASWKPVQCKSKQT